MPDRQRCRPPAVEQDFGVLVLADWFLTVVHIAIVLGFVSLWVSKRTARLHRWLVIGTAASWIVLGLWKGFGYCILTDLHWQVKRARGVTRLPGSFLKYAADFVTGTDVPPHAIDVVAAITFFAGCAAATWRFWQERTDNRARASRGPLDESS